MEIRQKEVVAKNEKQGGSLMVRLLVVDDHLLVAQGTKKLLEEEEEQFQVDLAQSGREALEKVCEHLYDLYVLDWRLQDMLGEELVRQILIQQPSAKVVMYTAYEIASYAREWLQLGVSGFVGKEEGISRLVEVIRCALRGEIILPLEWLCQWLEEERDMQEGTLNDWECAVLHDLAGGLSNKDIARKYHMSQRSFERRLTLIFRRLGVASRGAAVEKARNIGIISDSETPVRAEMISPLQNEKFMI